MLNVCMLGAAMKMVGGDLKVFEDMLTVQFLKRKGQAVVDANVGVARAGYNHAAEHFTAFDAQFQKQEPALAVVDGNSAMAMGGAAAGVK